MKAKSSWPPGFVCWSDSVSPLDMAGPICEELLMLESEGVEMYNAKSCDSTFYDCYL